MKDEEADTTTPRTRWSIAKMAKWRESEVQLQLQPMLSHKGLHVI
jgi:hypothetical protein